MGCKVSNESKEWFKVIEIADLLRLSKVIIYNKIKTLDNDVLQPLQSKEKGIAFYNYKIIDMIRDNPINTIKEEVAADTTSDKYIDIYISELKEEIRFLKEQIRAKADFNDWKREQSRAREDVFELRREATRLTPQVEILSSERVSLKQEVKILKQEKVA